MPSPYEPVTVEPKQGGALNTQDSLEDVGPQNYVVKRDWRRSFDAEVRREGDILFQPSSGSINNQPYPEVGTPITLVHNCRRANGQTALIVGTQTTLYRYFTFNDGAVYDGAYQSGVYSSDAGDWLVIGQNFSTNGARWEAVDVGGLTVLNNGYDLPHVYDLSKRYVEPLYELREQGIASVGTIAEFNGMLLCMDISNMTPAYLTTVMTGISSAGFFSTIHVTQSGTTVTSDASFFTAAMVGQMIVFSTGQRGRIVTYTSPTSVTVDRTQNVATTTAVVAILYGVAQDATQISRVRYQIINSLIGDATAFGALSGAAASMGSTKLVLSQPMYSLKQGDQVIVTGIGDANAAVTANVIAVDNVNHNFVYVDKISQQSTQSVSFFIAATASSGTLTYQWNFNGGPIPGATSATYTINNVSTANAGNYNVTLYDATGSASSNVASLVVYNVNPPPIIVTQPQNVAQAFGSSVSFTVAVQSGDPVSYQWTMNGVDINGGLASTYTIPSVRDTDIGLYACTVTNSEGSTTSNVATLTVPPPAIWITPTITTQPANTTATAGQTVSMRIVASGIPDITYQWYKNSVAMPGQTANILTFNPVQLSDGATYGCTIKNSVTAVSSTTAVLTVNAPVSGPTITTQTFETPTTVFAPANVTIQKATYPNSAISSQNLQDDGSAIIRAMDLRGTLVVLKETTIFIGTFTGSVGGPISYQRIYKGPDCIYWRWFLSVVDGTYLIYATQKDFFTFDLTLLIPRKHPQLRLSSSVFYGLGLTQTAQDSCFASTNELTREVWFMFPSSPDSGLCFDYEWNTVSTVGQPYTAASTVALPTATTQNDPKKVFVLGDASGTIRTYGLDTETGGTWTRSGSTYTSSLTGGLVSFGDEYNEKDLRTYMAYCRQLAPFTVTLLGTRNAHEPPTTLFTETISSPTYQTLIPTYFRQNYFQDQIVVSGSTQNCSLVRRLFDADRIESRGTIKHT